MNNYVLNILKIAFYRIDYQSQKKIEKIAEFIKTMKLVSAIIAIQH